MTTFTLNRNFDFSDCLFVALNDNCYADWKESQCMDMTEVKSEKVSVLEKIRKILTKR